MKEPCEEKWPGGTSRDRWRHDVWTSAHPWIACWERALLLLGFHWGGKNKAPQINKNTSSKTNYICFLKKTSRPIITPPSPPGHGHCSQRRGPHALIEPAQLYECCGRRNSQTPLSAGSGVSPPLLAREGALHRERKRDTVKCIEVICCLWSLSYEQWCIALQE